MTVIKDEEYEVSVVLLCDKSERVHWNKKINVVVNRKVRKYAVCL